MTIPGSFLTIPDHNPVRPADTTSQFAPFSSIETLYVPVLARIETRTSLWRSARQVTVAYDMSLWEELHQPHEQQHHLVLLLASASVSIVPLLIQSALVAHADGAAIERAAVRPHLQQLAMLRHLTIAADEEMVADGAELPCLMVAQELAHTIVNVAASASAVNNDITYTLLGVHHAAVLNRGVQLPLALNVVSADGHRKTFSNHIKNFFSLLCEHNLANNPYLCRKIQTAWI